MLYWVFRAILIIVLKTLYRVKVEGLENLPRKSNFIIVSNHASWLDALFFLIAIPVKIFIITSRYLYKISSLRWFLICMDAVPTGKSSEKTFSLLGRNKVTGIFPEGGCTRDGKLRRFKRGAALLAFKTGRPIVPCAILGTYEAYPVGARFPKIFMPVRIKIGKPIYLLKRFEDRIDDIDLQDGTSKIKKAIEDMIYAG